MYISQLASGSMQNRFHTRIENSPKRISSEVSQTLLGALCFVVSTWSYVEEHGLVMATFDVTLRTDSH